MQNVVQLSCHGRLTFRERIAGVERLLAIEHANMRSALRAQAGRRPTTVLLFTIIHHLRDRLPPYGVEITTEFGTGWYLKDKDRKKLEQLLECRP